MTISMRLEDLISLGQNTLDNDFYEIRALYGEYYPEAPITNGALVQFVLDQFKQMWEEKGITLVIR
jgi:hypothetical protein